MTSVSWHDRGKINMMWRASLLQVQWFCIVLVRDLVFVLEVPFQNIHDGGHVFQTQIE